MTIVESFAKALKEILQEENISIGNFMAMFKQVHDVLNEKEIRPFFISPAVNREKKKEILKKALHPNGDNQQNTDNLRKKEGDFLEYNKTNRLILSFLFLLLDRNCFELVIPVTKSLILMNNEKMGKITANVQTNRSLSLDLKKAVKISLEKFFGRSVELREIVSSKYIAGLKVQALGFVFDNTTLFHLNQMENQIRSSFYDNKSQ